MITIVTWQSAGALGKTKNHVAKLLAGPEVQHYHQAVALVVAETFEQARAAARLIRVRYAPDKGRYDLAAQLKTAPLTGSPNSGSAAPPVDRVGDFEGAFAKAPIKLDQVYTTPDQSHSMMEPHATIAAWAGDTLTVWTSTQMVAWAVNDLSEMLTIPKTQVRVVSPYIGGGFGAKLRIKSDVLLAALGARAASRPVKVALERAQLADSGAPTTPPPASMRHASSCVRP